MFYLRTDDQSESMSRISEGFLSFSDINLSSKNAFIQSFKAKKKEINRLFNVQLGLFKTRKQKDPKSYLRFVQGCRKYFFGYRGIVCRKLRWVNNLFRMHYKESEFLKKIQAGRLYYLETKKDPNTYAHRVTENKKNYFRRSSQFSIEEPFKPNFMMSSRKNTKRKVRTPKSTFLTNVNTSSHHCSPLSYDSSVPERIKKLRITTKPKEERSRNGIFFHKTSSNFRKYSETVSSKNKRVQTKLETQKFRRTFNFMMSPSSRERLMQKRLNTTTTVINQKIKNIIRENSFTERKLIKVFSRGNSPPSLMLNEFLGTTKKVDVPGLESQYESEKKKDLEAALDIKITANAQKNLEKVAEKMKENDNSEYVRAVVNLAEELTRMNEETSLKFSKDIFNNYQTKLGLNKKKKIQFFNSDSRLRVRLKSNFHRMDKMLFQYGKIKKKLYEPQENNVL